MFERYQEESRRTLFLARETALGEQREMIEPEHLLAGLLRAAPETLPARLPQEKTIETIRQRLGLRPFDAVPDGMSNEIPFSWAVQRLLNEAMLEADAIGDEVIRPGHLLLALLSLTKTRVALREAAIDRELVLVQLPRGHAPLIRNPEHAKAVHRIGTPILRVLVTGATGSLGRHLAIALPTAGHILRGMSRGEPPNRVFYDGGHLLSPRARAAIANGARPARIPDRPLKPPLIQNQEWARADIASGEGLQGAFRDVDAVVHAATDPKNAIAVDVKGTKRLVEAAAAAKIAHFVYVSIVGIDDIPYAYYKCKQEAEGIVRSSGVPYSIFRATQFHSLIDALLAKVARVPLVMPLPKGVRFQSVAESEVAEHLAMCLAEEPRRGVFEFGGPEVLTIGDMARVWLQARNLRRSLLNIPLPGAVAAGFRAGRNTTSNGRRGTTSWCDWLTSRQRC
jgi:uncharacterized protein YbjT (DUF2867 family)